jgi:hypothetical protein
MLSKMSQSQKANMACAYSFVEPRFKTMMRMAMIKMGHECKMGAVGGGGSGRRRKGYLLLM